MNYIFSVDMQITMRVESVYSVARKDWLQISAKHIKSFFKTHKNF